MNKNIDERIIEAASKVSAKRPKTVIDHILKHGFITTQELESLYGYNHPPRAARDVREAGIPLTTFRVTGRDGRKIGAYKFGDPSKIERHKLEGRRTFSKELKDKLYLLSKGRCDICGTSYESRYLQIDHRIPYEVIGDEIKEAQAAAAFMLLCGSCQRSKSWTCEQCENWKGRKEKTVCASCYWADLDNHTHLAQQQVRRLDVTWVGEEVAVYDVLRESAKKEEQPISRIVKDTLRKVYKPPTT